MSETPAVVMPDVKMGEKVFVRLDGKIRQVKIVGFRTAYTYNKGANHEAYMIVYMGKSMGTVLAAKDGGLHKYFQWPLFRTVDDAVRGNAIGDIKLSRESFNDMYLSKLPLTFQGYSNRLSGWMFKDNRAELIQPKHVFPRESSPSEVEVLNGEVRYMSGYGDNPFKPTYVGIDQIKDYDKFFRSKEACLANSAPDVVYLDDEE